MRYCATVRQTFPWKINLSAYYTALIFNNLTVHFLEKKPLASKNVRMELTFIKDLRVGLKNVNLTFIVLEVGRPSTTKEGHEIRTCRVADRTAAIHLSVWDSLGTYIQPGDILSLTKGYVALWKGVPTLYMGKGGELVKTGEFMFIFNEAINMSDPSQQTVQAPNQIKAETENPAPLTTAD